jgi:hypothetical protein
MAEMQDNGRFGAPEYGDSYYTNSSPAEAGEGYGAAPRNPLGTLTNVAGAALSLGLLIGVGVWGYHLVVRDVSGVPVVRAAKGPMRVVPEDPGGARAENQGLAINQIAATGGAARPAERVILAPSPLDLDAEDTVPVALSPSADASARGGTEVAETSATVEDLVNQLMAEAQPFDATEVIQPISLTQDDTAAAPQPEITASRSALAGGLGRSLRPKVRPAQGARIASLSPGPVPSVLDLDPDGLPAGTRLAQLGAYESEAVARREWDRIATRFGDFMKDKQRVVQKAQSAGSTFYRLRVHGFSDMNDARRFCAALQAEGAECISVSHK